MPSREAVLGFLFSVVVLVAGFVLDLPWVFGALAVLVFGGWIFFSIRDSIQNHRKGSA